MDFKTAVITCLRLKYANFTDRAPRSEYWWFMLLSWLSIVVLMIIMLVLATSFSPSVDETVFQIFVFIAAIAWLVVFLIPSLAVTIRRFHDIDMSGWWLLGFWALGAIPLVGTIASIVNIVLFCKQGTDGPNRFGKNPFAVEDYEKTFQ